MSWASLAVRMIQEESSHDTLYRLDILQWIGVGVPHEFETTYFVYFTIFFCLRKQPVSLCNLKVLGLQIEHFEMYIIHCFLDLSKIAMQYSI
jgi:hypothetical protein